MQGVVGHRCRVWSAQMQGVVGHICRMWSAQLQGVVVHRCRMWSVTGAGCGLFLKECNKEIYGYVEEFVSLQRCSSVKIRLHTVVYGRMVTGREGYKYKMIFAV